MADDKLKNFIKELEGYSSEIYDDTKGNPTVGYGTNLNSPEVSGILEQKKIDINQEMTPEAADAVMVKQLEEKLRYFDTIKQKDFPNAQLTENQQRALISAGYNTPRIWGPNLRQKLDANDHNAVAEELMLRSNKEKSPGIQKRRMKEALEYSGSLEELQKVYESLPYEQQMEMVQPILNIKNLEERQKTLDEFPFLRPKTRFRKIRNRGG